MNRMAAIEMVAGKVEAVGAMVGRVGDQLCVALTQAEVAITDHRSLTWLGDADGLAVYQIAE